MQPRKCLNLFGLACFRFSLEELVLEAAGADQAAARRGRGGEAEQGQHPVEHAHEPVDPGWQLTLKFIISDPTLDEWKNAPAYEFFLQVPFQGPKHERNFYNKHFWGN